MFRSFLDGVSIMPYGSLESYWCEDSNPLLQHCSLRSASCSPPRFRFGYPLCSFGAMDDNCMNKVNLEFFFCALGTSAVGYCTGSLLSKNWILSVFCWYSLCRWSNTDKFDTVSKVKFFEDFFLFDFILKFYWINARLTIFSFLLLKKNSLPRLMKEWNFIQKLILLAGENGPRILQKIKTFAR